MDEKVTRTICQCCHTNCGILVQREENGKISVKGDPEHPMNRGFICVKGRAQPELLYHPDRLKYPMKRTGNRGEGNWQRVSWEEALDDIAHRLTKIQEQYGTESIAVITGTGPRTGNNVARLFSFMFGTPNKISVDNIIGIGIGAPGPIDINTGEILDPENLPSLNFFNIREYFSGKYKTEVKLNNDAACFVLGEHIAGKGKGYKNVVGLTLGTGTGCGLIINGKLYNGSTGTSGELWKTPYLEGDIEDYTSAKAVRNFFYKLGSETLSAGKIAELAEKGNKNALESWAEFGWHLGILISWLIWHQGWQ